MAVLGRARGRWRLGEVEGGRLGHTALPAAAVLLLAVAVAGAGAGERLTALGQVATGPVPVDGAEAVPPATPRLPALTGSGSASGARRDSAGQRAAAPEPGAGDGEAADGLDEIIAAPAGRPTPSPGSAAVGPTPDPVTNGGGSVGQLDRTIDRVGEALAKPGLPESTGRVERLADELLETLDGRDRRGALPRPGP